jgi:hypothetical protein
MIRNDSLIESLTLYRSVLLLSPVDRRRYGISLSAQYGVNVRGTLTHTDPFSLVITLHFSLHSTFQMFSPLHYHTQPCSFGQQHILVFHYVQLLTFWTLSTVLFTFKTMFRRLIQPPSSAKASTHLSPNDRAGPYLRTPEPTQGRIYKANIT